MPDRPPSPHEVLRSAQDLGLLGPGPVEDQRRHAEAFCRLVAAGLPTDAPHFLDLGSGAGLPGLVLAVLLPRSTGTLLDSQQRRGRFLEEAVHTLGMTDRLEVVTARAEDAARDPAHRAPVRPRRRPQLRLPRRHRRVRRPPPPAPGHLAVSEPPEEAPGRWDEAQLRELGLAPAHRWPAPKEPAPPSSSAQRTPSAEKWPRKARNPPKTPPLVAVPRGTASREPEPSVHAPRST